MGCFRITCRCYLPNLKSLGQVLHVLECCRTAAGLLQICCRTAADLMQIMKAHYLKMLHAKFEVSRSNSMAVRAILAKRLKKEEKEEEEKEKEIVTSVTYIAGLGPAKKTKRKLFKKNIKMLCLVLSTCNISIL